ncbi:MAG TPA: DUF3806 domain-containing protein [Steroidobacteraceae bacterium]|jgi:hypothetical protein
MGRITNIIDAIRRIGSPAEQSALRRQDAYLDGKAVTDRRRETGRSSLGTSERLLATTEAVPEAVRLFNAEELRAIEENSALLPTFAQLFYKHSPEMWGADDFDTAFVSWAAADNRDGFDEEGVVQILGAAFGQYCARMLKMRWVVITDRDGSAAALQGVDKDFRAFPFHAIRKRIRDHEVGFFRPIYITLEEAAGKDWARPVTHSESRGT